ncbi:recombinase family protein [Sphingomonas sp. KRR8]|uniref:recombinase family protein n=1 Tax=Sphingomonas sp. KRR8 TaxID=2942996 RepID=UPI002021ED2A|nr:recombinase family protein [Sphingomonas sp. KRR8]URD59931.1 recombinase family protein [Sphingomonas sp. KRR8]
MKLRACGYVRVSTDDQAQHGISLPSQISKVEEFCAARGWELVEVLQEPGMSGKDEGRPVFRKMMSLAQSALRPFDVIVVFALSRFARKLSLQTNSFDQLQAVGVGLASVTETFGKGPNGNLMRSMVGAFNQHVSDQSSVNTIRTMNENAAQGFWNGGPIPFGYLSITVERRKDKEKKKLAVQEAEAEVVRQIFRLARYGDGKGPLGARGIAQWLNSRGYTLRGARFKNSNVAGILSRTHYVGYYLDGKKNEFKEPLPEDQWITVPCPAIISEEEFLEVAALRAKRSPRVTPPRVTNGTTLLPATIAKCGQPGCGAGLTVRTGKSGAYHYYCCSARVNEGATACNLPSTQRDELEGAVIGALQERLFAPSRLPVLLSHLLDRSADADKRRRKDLGLARSELTSVSRAITNLMILVERDVSRLDEPEFAERMAHNRARKSVLEADVKALEAQLAKAKVRITKEMIKTFGERMRTALRDGDRQFRSAYVRLFVDQVTVTPEEIVITGSKAALERTLVKVDDPAREPVPIFDREWCRLQDSNL